MEYALESNTLSNLFEIYCKLFMNDLYIIDVDSERKIIEIDKIQNLPFNETEKSKIVKSSDTKIEIVYNKYRRGFIDDISSVLRIFIGENIYGFSFYLKKYRKENIIRMDLLDGVSRRVRKKYKIDEIAEFDKFIKDWCKKFEILERYLEYAKFLSNPLDNPYYCLYSMRKFSKIKKYIKEINEFNQRKDSNEYKNLLKELKDFCQIDTKNNNYDYYQDKDIEIWRSKTKPFIIEVFKSRLKLDNNLLERKFSEEDNFKDEDVLRIFLPIFKALGGAKKAEENILKRRLIEE